MKNKSITILAILILLLISVGIPVTGAQSAVVRAILFYSPTCPHCHEVINNVLPPLMDKYDQKLDIIGIDITQEPGWQLYQSAINTFQIANDRQGVPTMIIGATVLVGSAEITDQFSQLIDQQLASGGVDWPQLPGLEEITNQQTSTSQDPAISESSSWLENFQRDPVANSLSVFMLIFVLAIVIRSLYLFIRGQGDVHAISPAWVVPVLSLVGLLVAFYLAYVESTQTNAICGPVGDCNTVQQSEYSVLFGMLPVGVLGIIGYTLILASWGVQAYGPMAWKNPARLVIWAMALFGSIFSIYLTFLEPFVIGATCMWCLSSALIMAVIFWAVTPAGITAWQRLVAPGSKNRRSPRRA